jgi:hypothetical protein
VEAVAQQKEQARLPDLKKALAMPLSPGSIALLAVHAAHPGHARGHERARGCAS